MSVRVDAFVASDLVALPVQASQARDLTDPWTIGCQWQQAGGHFTIRRAAGGVPLFCGGAFATHAGYATLRSAIAEDAGPYMLAITRRTARFVAMLRYARVDTFVRAEDRAGRRWIEQLGFYAEAEVGAVFPDGGDAVIYRKAG